MATPMDPMQWIVHHSDRGRRHMEEQQRERERTKLINQAFKERMREKRAKKKGQK